jgi:hypothetical protein
MAMKRNAMAFAVGVLGMTLAGCSSGWWPFGRASGEASRIPAGATEFACAQGKRFFVRFDEGGKSAWVILPDREFRLQQSGASDRYGNGVSTLSLQDDNAQLDTEGIRQYADCKRKSS